MKINPAIFRTYDIRGRVPKELNAEVARRIGNAAAVFLSRKYHKHSLTFLVGSDVRTSSPILKKALIEGIILQGSSVIDIGMVTTPLFYFALDHSKNDGGVMVTPSHNPPEYNGFKIRGRNTEAIVGDNGLGTIQKLASRGELVRGKMMGGVSEGESKLKEYVDFIRRRVKVGRVKVVVDAAGGSAALVLPELLSRFPSVVYKPLFFKPDGSFSVHSPNPLIPEAQKFIQEELRGGGFDLGVVFDGDADRVVFFDEFGNEVRADFILALLVEDILKAKRRSWIVLELTSSKAVEERIRELGGRAVRAKVGYAHMTRMMKKKRAPIGGEISAHFFFQELGYNESSMYALMKILEIVSRSPRKLSHLIRPLQKYASGYQLNFEVKNKQKVLRAIEKRYQKAGKISKLDGVSVEMSDLWFNVRPSNNEPVVRLTLEAKTKEIFDAKQKELSDFIRSIR